MTAIVSELPAHLAQFTHSPQLATFHLQDFGPVPNSRLPLILYRSALTIPAQEGASFIEELFTWNHWHNCWRGEIYPFHHYHSNAHEVLAVFGGTASIQFGGEWGVTQDLAPGDVVIIPAGVAHKNLGASPDFGVVGAYPEWQDWDMNYCRPEERPRTDRNISRVPLPENDPVYGPHGPLIQHWRV